MNQQRSPLLFQPGSGQLPPYLAGREAEQRGFTELLQQLQTGRGAPADVILTGPRGNGKTVLLRWFQQIVKQHDIDVVWLTPDEIPDLGRLANILTPPGLLQRLGRKLRGIGLLGLKAELDTTPLSEGSLDEALVKRCRQTPLVLLLDEAHTLDIEVGRTLLNTSQKVRAEAPFLLAMAGTPNLPAHLNEMGATFWSRAEQLGVGRISPDATAQALTIPLDQAGVQVDLAALDTVVAETQCYPYFIQLWGSALWQQAQQNDATLLEQSHVDAARPEAAEKQTAFYELRWKEMKMEQLLPVAEHLAAAWPPYSTLTEVGLDKLIAAALPVSDPAYVDAARDTLLHLGYLWQPPTSSYWEPGIPSLMTYVQTHETNPA